MPRALLSKAPCPAACVRDQAEPFPCCCTGSLASPATAGKCIVAVAEYECVGELEMYPKACRKCSISDCCPSFTALVLAM